MGARTFAVAAIVAGVVGLTSGCTGSSSGTTPADVAVATPPPPSPVTSLEPTVTPSRTPPPAGLTTGGMKLRDAVAGADGFPAAAARVARCPDAPDAACVDAALRAAALVGYFGLDRFRVAGDPAAEDLRAKARAAQRLSPAVADSCEPDPAAAACVAAWPPFAAAVDDALRAYETLGGS